MKSVFDVKDFLIVKTFLISKMFLFWQLFSFWKYLIVKTILIVQDFHSSSQKNSEGFKLERISLSLSVSLFYTQYKLTTRNKHKREFW